MEKDVILSSLESLQALTQKQLEHLQKHSHHLENIDLNRKKNLSENQYYLLKISVNSYFATILTDFKEFYSQALENQKLLLELKNALQTDFTKLRSLYLDSSLLDTSLKKELEIITLNHTFSLQKITELEQGHSLFLNQLELLKNCFKEERTILENYLISLESGLVPSVSLISKKENLATLQNLLQEKQQKEKEIGKLLEKKEGFFVSNLVSLKTLRKDLQDKTRNSSTYLSKLSAISPYLTEEAKKYISSI